MKAAFLNTQRVFLINLKSLNLRIWCLLSACLFFTYVESGRSQADNPWREIDGQTNDVKINGVWFGGRVQDILQDGIRVQGSYGRAIYGRANDGRIGMFPITAYNGDFFCH